jgi:hypothetical protein
MRNAALDSYHDHFNSKKVCRHNFAQSVVHGTPVPVDGDGDAWKRQSERFGTVK